MVLPWLIHYPTGRLNGRCSRGSFYTIEFTWPSGSTRCERRHVVRMLLLAEVLNQILFAGCCRFRSWNRKSGSDDWPITVEQTNSDVDHCGASLGIAHCVGWRPLPDRHRRRERAVAGDALHGPVIAEAKSYLMAFVYWRLQGAGRLPVGGCQMFGVNGVVGTT